MTGLVRKEIWKLLEDPNSGFRHNNGIGYQFCSHTVSKENQPTRTPRRRRGTSTDCPRLWWSLVTRLLRWVDRDILQPSDLTREKKKKKYINFIFKNILKVTLFSFLFEEDFPTVGES